MVDQVKSICIEFPLLGGTYLAQLVLPRALCKQDAERLIGLIKCWPQTVDDPMPLGSRGLEPPSVLPFVHWSKDPLIPYADCTCSSCEDARKPVEISVSDSATASQEKP